MLPAQPVQGAQVGHAVGLAWSLALRNEPGVALVFFDDAWAPSGDVVEAAQLADGLGAPVILVRSTTAAGRSCLAGLTTPTVTVDGADPLAVATAVGMARDRAIAGQGPTMIDAVVSPGTDRGPADPVASFRRDLEDRGIWDRAMQLDAERTAHREFDEAVLWASNLPLRRSDLFDDVFEGLTARLRSQRASLEAELKSSV